MKQDYYTQIFFKKFKEKLEKDLSFKSMKRIDISLDAEKAFSIVFSKIDPTPNKKYSKWILSRYSSDGIDLWEDVIGRTKNSLELFHKLKITKKLPIKSREIMQIKSLIGLEDLLEPYKEKTLFSSDQEKEAKKGAKKLFNTDSSLLLEITSKEASILYGQNTKWCTSSIENNMAENYLNNGPLYIFIDKKENRKFQFHTNNNNLMDERDKPVDTQKFTKNYPEFEKYIHDSNLYEINDMFNIYDQNKIHDYPRKAFQILNSSKKINIDLDDNLKLKLEESISKSPQYSYQYAKKVIKGRFEKGEETIAKNSYYSLEYAKDVIKEKFEKGEEAIEKNVFFSLEYTRDVLKERLL